MIFRRGFGVIAGCYSLQFLMWTMAVGSGFAFFGLLSGVRPWGWRHLVGIPIAACLAYQSPGWALRIHRRTLHLASSFLRLDSDGLLLRLGTDAPVRIAWTEIKDFSRSGGDGYTIRTSRGIYRFSGRDIPRPGDAARAITEALR